MLHGKKKERSTSPARTARVDKAAATIIEPVGRRERHKLEKRQRIVAAAQRLFHEQGYDSTTTRAIAEAADVATGTVFAYATDKRDLLLMVLNDRLEAIFTTAAASVPANRPLLEQLVRLFKPAYEFFAAERDVALYGLREIATIGEPGPADSQEVSRFHERRQWMRNGLADIITRARENGQIARAGAHPADVADIILAIQSADVRRWLSHLPCEPDIGLRRLRNHLEVLVNGLGPARSASRG